MNLNLPEESYGLPPIAVDSKVDEPKQSANISVGYDIMQDNQVMAIRGKRVIPILETLIANNTYAPIISFNNLGSPKVEPKERGVEFDWYIPGKLNNKSMKTVLKSINDEIPKVWRLKTSEYAFDIDIKLEFQKNLEDNKFEAIYTVFVPNLRKSDIPKIWSELRNSFNMVIESKKRQQKKFRETFNKLSEITFIQLDW